MLIRPRRNRKSHQIREMVAETTLSASDFIFPLFVKEGEGIKEEIPSMPGIYRYSLDLLVEEVGQCQQLGLNAVAIFPCIEDHLKNPKASEAMNPEGLYLRAITEIKSQFPQTVVMSDVAMDPYSSDGHDGVVHQGEILNDETLGILSEMALHQARAGANIIGPSDMMDGRVKVIRQTLDQHQFQTVSIMSYTAKYASAFYGPFRDALDSAPRYGDKKSYQMDPRNQREALIEGRLDQAEGADYLMVKPALAYLDVIKLLRDNFDLPIAAYNVSGEYAMIKAAHQRGWLDGPQTMIEVLTAIRRAGADLILSYFAKEYAALASD